MSKVVLKYFWVLGFVFLLVQPACKISYSFSGASISPEVKTVSVQFFPNRARIVNPTLSQEFTDALKDKIKGQTDLSFVNDLGDVNFEGEITDYSTQPLAITGDQQAAMNRFTLTVRVKFSNAIDPDQDFDSSFSRYLDYDSRKDFASVEQDLIEEILKDLTEDIFNKAFVNW